MMMTRRDTVAAFALFAEMLASSREAQRRRHAEPPRRGRRSSSTICRTSRSTAGR